MSPRRSLIAVLFLTAAGLLALWLRSGEDPGRRVGAASVDDSLAVSGETDKGTQTRLAAGAVGADAPRLPAGRKPAGEEDGPGVPEWRLELFVTGPGGPPLAGVEAHVRGSRRAFDLRARTDEQGACALDLEPPPADHPDEEVLASLRLTRAGLETSRLFLTAGEFRAGGGVLRKRVAMRHGSVLLVTVTDDLDRPLADAVVLLHALETGAEAWEVDRIDHHRLVTDEHGEAWVAGLAATTWQAQAVRWRGWDAGEPQVVELLPGERARVNLEATLLDPLEFASGRVIFGGEELSADVEPKGYYFRRTGLRSPTEGLYSGGDFYLPVEAGVPSEWELVGPGGRVCGDSVQVEGGMHRLRYDATCPLPEPAKD